MRGIVFECGKRHAVVVTPEGRFLKLRWNSLSKIGDEIEFEVKNIMDTVRTGLVKYLSMAACFIFVALSALFAYNYNTAFNTVYAYIAIDINPSLEVSVNKFEKIISVNYMNEDAKNLLADNNIEGMDLKAAVARIADISKKKGYIAENKDNNILITAVLAKDTGNDSDTGILIQVCEDAVKNAVKENKVKVDVETVAVNAGTREEARNEGMSAGKYVVYREAVAEGLKISKDDMKNKSMSRVIKQAGGDFNEIVKKIRKNKNHGQQKKQEKQSDENNTDDKNGDRSKKDGKTDNNYRDTKEDNNKDHDKNKDEKNDKKDKDKLNDNSLGYDKKEHKLDEKDTENNKSRSEEDHGKKGIKILRK